MPKLTTDHPKLRSFTQHGVYFDRVAGSNAKGTCPFCGKQKFFANVETRAWDCKVCGRSGGLRKFLAEKAIDNQEGFKGKVVLRLKKSRGLDGKTLRAWGIGWDGRNYTIPVDGLGELIDLRRYSLNQHSLTTTGGKIGLVGKATDSNEVWICEGEWDGMALWEAMQKLKKDASVLAVTGAQAFPHSAVHFFQGKTVNVAFDHDEGGQKGAMRIYQALHGIAKEVKFVHWPEDTSLGDDVRDVYEQKGKRVVAILRKRLEEEPQSTLLSDADTPQEVRKVEQPTGPGMKIEDIIKGYRKWMHLPDPEVLSVLFGAILANRMEGDPLWLFLVAPPGGSKSMILMSLAGAPLIFTTTSLTPHALVSGANFTGGGDPSLVPKLNEKVLVIKDFTTILNMPQFQRDEIFGTLRDVYDGRTEKIFGNGTHRAYDSKFGILAGVTPVIDSFAQIASTLGERFLKYRLTRKGKIDVGKDVIMKALQNIAHEGTMAKNLREIAQKALDVKMPKKMPEMSHKMAVRIMRLAQWIASLRGVVSREKYTNEVMFKPVAEIGTRLAKQLAKLGIGIAILHRKKAIDEEVFQVISRVARDTAPDRVEEIIKQLYLRTQKEYASTVDISSWCRFPSGTVVRLLQDLVLLHIVVKDPDNQGYWKLSRSMLQVMRPLGIYTTEETWGKAKKQRIAKRKKRRG